MSRFVLTAQLQLQAPNNVAQVVRQIQSQLNNVTVNVQVQGAQQAQRQIQQITQNTNNATTAAERMGRAFAVSVRRFAAFSIATRAVGLFTSTLGDAVQTAIDFERQLVKISQVTGESLSKLSKLTSTITDLSTGLGVSSQSLLEVSTILLQAGLNSKDTEVALKSLARAALAPNFDSITETAEGAIAILAQFQEGVGSLEKQLGSINAVAGAFAVEAGDLIDVIRRTGGVFKASGGDLNELLALFTSVRATTRESAESIGTGLRTIFTRIQRPQTIEFLKQFGVELVDLEGKFVGPFEAVKRLSGALAGLGEGDLTFIRVAEELGGFRQIGKVLPLLQQFSVAQSALNVAQKSGNSLAQDAATAQQALAIRITKVKEEFLALVRSITETATFQIMANTALSLATSLIKLADSIKPLLPLLGALAAIRIARGLGSFLGGIGGGLASARTFNKGGKVHHFARGGMVPGTGNRDTVPAMLSPGEFVIRKSSVQKLGAANLAAMNENRYEDGGPMTMAQKLARARGAQKIQKTESQTKKKKFTSGRDKDELMFSVDPGNIGAFFMNKEGTPDGLKPFKQKTFDITNPKLLSLNGVNPYKNKGDKMAGKPDTFSAKGILQAGQIQTFYPSIGDIQSGSLSQIIQSNVKNKLSEAVMSVANEVSSKKLLDIPPIDSNDALLSSAAKRIQSDAGAIRTTSGYLYEGVIDALTGAKPASGNAVFDFPSSSLQGSRKRLAALFGNETGISKLKQADAKASYSSKIIDGDAGSGSISSKIINSINNGVLSGIKIQKKHFGGLIQKFATGGEVGGPELFTVGSLRYSIDDMKAAAKRKGITLDKLKELMQERKINPRTGAESLALEYYDLEKQFGLLSYRPPDSALYQKTMAAKLEKQDRIETFRQKQGLATREYEGGSERQKGFLAARQRRRGFATGGGVGTDTVPALLTPGEFVINRASAQNIGYGALNRMNKVGRYAKGGVVQRFATGTAGTGVKPSFDRVGSQAFGINPRIFGILEKTVFSVSDLIRGLGSETAKTRLAFANIQTVVPALVDSVRANAIANNRTQTAQEKIALKYSEYISSLQRQGKSDAEIQAAMARYIKALDNDTKAKNSSASSSKTSTSSRPATAPTSPTGPSNPWSTVGGTVGARSGGTGGGVGGSAGVNNSRGSGGMISDNKMFAASMATSLLQGFLPAVDESSGALTKLSHSLLGCVTTVFATMTALEAFGVSMKKQALMNFFSGGGIGNGGKQAVFNTVRGVGGSKDLAGLLTGTANGLAKLAGPLLAVVGGAALAQAAFNAIAESIYNFEGRLNKAIKSGNVEEAKSVALEKSNFQRGAGSAGGVVAATAAGAAIGSFIPVVGTAVGALVGLGTGLVGVASNFETTTKSAVDLAAAQAGAISTQKSLDQAQKTATTAMQDFERGTITASEALARIRTSTESATIQQNRALDFAQSNTENRQYDKNGNRTWGGYFRDVRATATFGYVDSAQERDDKLGEQSAEMIRKSNEGQARAFELQSPARQAAIRSGLARGQDPERVRREALGIGTRDDKLQRLRDLSDKATNLAKAGDAEGAAAAQEAFIQLKGQVDQINSELLNLEKEVARAKASFEAMNLGLRGAEATSTAMSASMARFASSFEAGSSAFVSDAEFLREAVSSAAQAMDPTDIKNAVSNVAQNLEKLGVSPAFVSKFENNTNAFVAAQQKYSQAFENVRQRIGDKAFKGLNAEDFRKELATELSNLVGGPAKENLKKAIEGINLTDDEIDQIIGGNYEVFGNKLGEAQQKQIESIIKIAQERQKAEQVIIQLTQKRIEAERKLVEAQQEALDLYLEGREVQAGAGGMAVTGAERRGVILGKANVEGDRLGLSGFRSGSAEELRRRNIELRAGAATYEERARTEGGLQGASGVEASEQQRDLQKAYRTQIDTIRSLIKLEQDELKIIQEKNKLEKQSMESLISGDIEKFFEQQAAVGATAAIATGNESLINQFGASALASAFQDIQRQMEAGVQSLYGVQLSGAGGLGEMAAQSALAARGIQSPFAAQSLAGTTPEEEGKRARIRELGGVLSETGQVGIDMAQMELNTAEIIVSQANIKLEEIIQRGNEAASGFARGGMVYASRGMFVPRGTDTVPAMLTPGEFVVNRRATQNNLQLLKAINSGNHVSGSGTAYANRGGKIRGGTQYLSDGGLVGKLMSMLTGMQPVNLDPQVVSNLASALNTFNKDLSANITNLQNTKFQIKLETANINVNFQGASFLSTLKDQIQKELFDQLAKELGNYRVGPGGNIVKSQTVLGK
jgi:TP901 family phage tail tape measure protein